MLQTCWTRQVRILAVTFATWKVMFSHHTLFYWNFLYFCSLLKQMFTYFCILSISRSIESLKVSLEMWVRVVGEGRKMFQIWRSILYFLTTIQLAYYEPTRTQISQEKQKYLVGSILSLKEYNSILTSKPWYDKQ